MKALVPKGYFYDRFPTESNTAAEINAREVESSRKVLSDQIIALEAQAQLLINKRKDFFASHFGLKPQAEISKLYLLDEQGNWKGVSTGAATNSIANEIMTYKSPAPSDSGLTQGEMVGLLMNMVKRYELQQQVSNLSTGLTAEDIKTIYTLERRPTYEEYKSVLETYNATNWGKQGIPLGQGKYVRPTLSNVLGYGYWKNSYLPSDYGGSTKGVQGQAYFYPQRQHSSGFTINVRNVLQYYERAYRSGRPESFWQFCGKHRIGIYTGRVRSRPPSTMTESLGTGVGGVVIYQVDPFTGAPNKEVSISDVIATGSAGVSAGTLLAQVRSALFPELYTLEAGVNYNVGDAKVRYAKELKAAKVLWEGVPDKVRTPLVSVATSQNPMTNISIYLQPTGIEQALARLTKGEPFQAWFDNMLGVKSFDANNLPKKMMTTQIADNEWKGYQDRLSNAITVLNTVLTHPETYSKGIYHTINQNQKSSQNKTDVEDLVGRAGWPTSLPSKLFEVYVDDTRDANVVINTLYNYLNDETLMRPPEMYLPESIKAKLEYAHYVPPKNPNVQSTSQGPDAGKTYNYEIAQKVSIPLTERADRVIYSPGKMTRRYFSSGKTVLSKQVVSSKAFLTAGVELREVDEVSFKSTLPFAGAQPEEVNLLIGIGALLTIGGIVYFNR